MGEWVVIVWVLVVTVVVLNGFAAGVAAVLHGWRSRSRRSSRAFLSSAVAGSLPASFFVIVPLAEEWESWESGWLMAIAVAFGLGALVSFPGALIVSRKLDGPGEAYKAFE